MESEGSLPCSQDLATGACPESDKSSVDTPFLQIIFKQVYGYNTCETWFSKIREHITRVSENRELRRKFRPKRDEVAGGWRRLHNEELYNLYASQILRRTNQGG
jgi:hypothetical protein